jgi:hypothetical protein
LSGTLAQRHGADRVFKDITSLRPADDWRAEVAAAIGRSTHVLVLVGPNWMAGVDPHGRRNGQPDPIVFELTEAFRTGRIVVPVLLGGARMPPAVHLPYALQRLPDLNAAHIRTESADDAIARLVDRLPPPSRTEPSAARAPAPSGGGRIVGRLVALAVLGALALAGVTLWDRLGGSVGGNEPGPTITRVNEPAPPQDNGAAPPQGDGPSPTKRSLKLTPESGTMTTRITATGTGFTPGAQVSLRFGAKDVTDAEVGPGGSVSASFTVPQFFADFPPDVYRVSVTELNSANSASALFTLNN